MRGQSTLSKIVEMEAARRTEMQKESSLQNYYSGRQVQKFLHQIDKLHEDAIELQRKADEERQGLHRQVGPAGFSRLRWPMPWPRVGVVLLPEPVRSPRSTSFETAISTSSLGDGARAGTFSTATCAFRLPALGAAISPARQSGRCISASD